MISHFSISSDSPFETRALACEITKHLEPGERVGLSGGLGAGKTEFVRGACEAYGAGEQVSSPSYVLQAVYSLNRESPPFEIQHWDLYRLGTEFSPDIYEEIRSNGSNLVFIEWAERQAEVEDLLGVKILLDFPPLEQRETEQLRVLSIDVPAGHALEPILARRAERSVKS